MLRLVKTAFSLSKWFKSYGEKNFMQKNRQILSQTLPASTYDFRLQIKPSATVVQRCSIIMAVEFAVLWKRTKGFNVLAIYCGRAYSICDK